MAIVVSCDAGHKGGFAVFLNGTLVKQFPMPTIKGKTSFEALKIMLQECVSDSGHLKTYFVIEEQFVPNGQGHSKEIYGNAGQVLGMARMVFHEVSVVASIKWKTALNLTSKGVLKKTKQHTIDFVNSRYCLDLTVKEDGVADAIAIGHHKCLLLGEIR